MSGPTPPADAVAEARERSLRTITERLVRRYGSTVPPELVATTVSSTLERWRDARVADYVLLLTERHSRRQLETMIRDGVPGVGTPPA